MGAAKYLLLLFQATLLFSTLSSSFAKSVDVGGFLESDESICDRIICRAGRECRVQSNGSPACVCVQSCEDHFVPVCGSNGKSYDNYCLLHKDACQTETHIRVVSKGYCPKPKSKSKEKAFKKALKNAKESESETLREPVVCFQSERDALRKDILAYFSRHQKDQSWYRPGLTAHEMLWGRFYGCDTSKDNILDANEFLNCAKDVASPARLSSGNSQLVKALCVDAIVDEGDKDSDWRLSFDEFKTVMNPDFKPAVKMCSLEGKKFEDGARTMVDCNDCVCACGSWVCTSKTCTQDKKKSTDELEDLWDDDGDEDSEEEDEELTNKLNDDDDEEDDESTKEWRRLLEDIKIHSN